MASKRTERRLAAILAADMVGYSRLMGADETGTIAQLKTHRKELIDPSIARHRGRIVKTTGDGLLIEFASVVDAVECAVEVQEGMAARGVGVPEDRRIQFRTGVNLGDIIIDGEDILGEGVNVAARLEGLAEPGGICLSDDAYRQVRDKLDLAFADDGEHELKNIARPIKVWRWTGAGAAAAEIDTWPALELPDKPSIAVLPFDNMSGDPEQEYFSDGITEDIITELSRFSELFVIARNSSFAYKGQSLDVRLIAKELGVRYILEGSIRRAAKRVRITGQLLDTETGSHLWAERYDRELEDIFNLQEEIARNVVAAIVPQIEMAELERARKIESRNVSAYDCALKAQALFLDALRMGSPDILNRAIETAEDSVKQDPRSIHGLAVLAFAYSMQYLYRWGPAPDQALERAWAVAERLAVFAQSDSRTFMYRGLVQQFRSDYEAAIADFRKASALNPNSATILFLMAFSESLSGLTAEAREHAKLALRLSPRDNNLMLGIGYLALTQASFADGDLEKTQEWGRLAIQMHPTAPIRRALMIACCGHAGDLDGAARQAEDLRSFAPDFIPSILRGEMTLYKMPEPNALLVAGLRKAGLTEK